MYAPPIEFLGRGVSMEVKGDQQPGVPPQNAERLLWMASKRLS